MHVGTYKAIGLDNHLLATYIIPRVRVPLAVDDHLLEQPIGSSSSPRDSDSDSGLTIRTPRTEPSGCRVCRAMMPDRGWSVSEAPLPAKTSMEWTEGPKMSNKLSVAAGLRTSTKPGASGALSLGCAAVSLSLLYPLPNVAGSCRSASSSLCTMELPR